MTVTITVQNWLGFNEIKHYEAPVWERRGVIYCRVLPDGTVTNELSAKGARAHADDLALKIDYHNNKRGHSVVAKLYEHERAQLLALLSSSTTTKKEYV